MDEPAGRYINPYTDYGFKYLFGTEPNKEFTLALVNELLRGREVIRSLTLIPSELLGDTKEDRRAALQERIFKKFFSVAETANLSKEEYAKYWESEKNYYDLDGAFRTASTKGYARGKAKGLAEGMEKGRAEGEHNKALESARNMKADGMPAELIAKYTGLTVEETNSLE